MYVIFNIETAVDHSSPSIASLSVEAMKAPAGWKDPVKIAERQEENFLKALDGAGLHPLTGQIICLSYQTYHQGGPETVPITFIEMTEQDILNNFKAYIARLDASILVTYNGELFDVPYTISRMMAHDIPIPEVLRKASQKKWDSHIDMFKVMNKKGKLKEWASRYHLDPVFGDGSLVQGWLETGDFMSIKSHCVDNVRVTRELLRRYVG